MNGRGARPPTPLTGGVGRTAPEERSLPDIGVAEPAPGYAHLIVQGWDSFQECLDVTLPVDLVERLEEAKKAAADRDDRGGAVVELQLSPETVQVRPHGGKGGAKWVFGNDDFLLMVRSPAQSWNVSVRYIAAGLWEHGLEALQNRVWDMLTRAGCRARSDDSVRVTRADWAFDFWSAAFSAEMRPEILHQVVCHSEAKKVPNASVPLTGVCRATMETLTIGSKSGLQLQVYDKTREITEASGKTWMVELWEREGFHPPDGELSNVWRLEVRMGAEYLKNRDIRTPGQLRDRLPELLTEALWTRRLTVPVDSDSNHRRWPLHPLFTLAWRNAGCTTLPPIGRHVTGKRTALHRTMVLQIAGTLRAATVLQTGAYRPADAEAIMPAVWNALLSDPRAGPKVAAALERYRYVDEAA